MHAVCCFFTLLSLPTLFPLPEIAPLPFLSTRGRVFRFTKTEPRNREREIIVDNRIPPVPRSRRVDFRGNRWGDLWTEISKLRSIGILSFSRGDSRRFPSGNLSKYNRKWCTYSRDVVDSYTGNGVQSIGVVGYVTRASIN